MVVLKIIFYLLHDGCINLTDFGLLGAAGSQFNDSHMPHDALKQRSSPQRPDVLQHHSTQLLLEPHVTNKHKLRSLLRLQLADMMDSFKNGLVKMKKEIGER